MGVSPGLITGIASGFGTYLNMPVPFVLAVCWLFGGLVRSAITVLIMGMIIKI